MEITIDDSLMILGSTSGLVRFFGSATVMPCWRNGVTTMKMISNTSMMSTIGVTLISDCRLPLPPPDPIAITNLLLIQPGKRRCGTGRTSGFTHLAFRYQLGLQLLRTVLDEVVDQF